MTEAKIKVGQSEPITLDEFVARCNSGHYVVFDVLADRAERKARFAELDAKRKASRARFGKAVYELAKRAVIAIAIVATAYFVYR